MAATKRFFWLRFKEDFFNQKEIKKLRRIAGGDTFTIIYLKMQLLSVKNEGLLTFDGTEENIAEQLSLEIDEDTDNIKITIEFLISNNLIEKVSEDNFLLNKVPPLIGKETDSAERMRRLRAKPEYESKKASLCSPDVRNSDTEIELEIEKKKELDKYNTCGEVSSETISASPVFISLPKIGSPSQPNATHNVTEEDIKKYENVYPGIDVRLELKKMNLWLDSNPANKKKNVKTFIAKWLARSQDRSRGDFNGKYADSPRKKYDRTANANFDGLKSGEVDF
jgi:predicted phage replisome organizer